MRTLSRRDFGKRVAYLAAAFSLSEPFVAKLMGWSARAATGTTEAWNYRKLAGKVTACNVCPRACELSPGELSHCKAKKNVGGSLISLGYGQVSTLHFDPLEKGPWYHVTPGMKGLAVGPSGCNLHCAYCQNWQVSQRSPLKTKNTPLSPSKGIEGAKTKKAKAIVFTYTEPVTYPRYLMDMCEAAKNEGLLTHVVSGGYANPGIFKKLSGNVDAFTLGLKGWANSFYDDVVGGDIEPVKNSIREIAGTSKWLEVVTLIVPTKNDDTDTARNVSRFVKSNTGKDTPLHFLRFVPAYKLRNLPQTPVSSLEKARNIALDEGMRYVYLGNVPGHVGQNTYCPGCKTALIKRVGFEIIGNKIAGGKCPVCNTSIPGLWI